MKHLVLILALVVSATSVHADPLRFVYHAGDQYRYYGTSTQNITVDGVFLQTSLQEYKVSYSVSEVAGDRGHLQGHITFLSRSQTNKAAAIDQEYDTDYWVDGRGVYDVPAAQVMPVVRNVPTLPLGEIKTGDTWNAPGEEVHDLRDDFGVDQLLRVPFDVQYTDLGTVERDGQTVRALRSDYSINKRTGFRYPKLKSYPIAMSGWSRQIHYFNEEKGREEGYEEEYSLMLTLSTGQVVVYSGKGGSKLIEAQVMDKPALRDEVQKSLEDRGLGNVQVTVAPRGVTLNLDNIQFPADSAVLVASEQAKLKLIAEILSQYPDRDILVEGHTANVVGGADPQTLSEARAASVGNFLLGLRVRQPDQIVYRGWGAQKPVAPNDTEANRAKNRRVEITLLEN